MTPENFWVGAVHICVLTNSPQQANHRLPLLHPPPPRALTFPPAYLPYKAAQAAIL